MKARHYLVSVLALAIALACGWLVTAVKLPPVADDLALTLLLLWLHHDEYGLVRIKTRYRPLPK
jgi:hypothetical protein